MVFHHVVINYQDFASDFVVLQRVEESFFGPMTVQIEDSIISSGSAGVLFDNDGGLLRMRNVEVERVVAASLVASANNAASFLEMGNIHSSEINSITYTTAGATQTVINTTVSRMNRLADAFYVEGMGSTLLLETVKLEQNKVQTDPWSGVSVRMEAIARIRKSSISDNTSVKFGVVTFQSTAHISDTLISRNVGSVRLLRTDVLYLNY
jgi:ABC-type glucose/galactose transport system permease subunit